MQRILRDLYYGDYSAFERHRLRGPEETEVLNLVVALEEKLHNGLSKEMWAIFEQYENASADLSCLTVEQDFIEGYRLGVRLMLAAFPEIYEKRHAESETESE